MELNDLPEMFRVEEAAAILRVSRTIAYEQAKQYERSGGREGLPVIRIGRVMRVPKRAFIDWIDSKLGRPDVAQDDDAA